jgi:Fe-S-cluster containining protein
MQLPPHLGRYAELVGRVDRAAAAVAARRADDLACRLGCTNCCQVQLTLSPLEAGRVREALEALDPDARERVRGRAAVVADGLACVMLEESGACAIYESRPLVCRTQGHALRYPAGTLPEPAVFALTDEGEITWCPLNYVERIPASEDVLEAQTIDELLARANLEAFAEAAAQRVSMVELALER